MKLGWIGLGGMGLRLAKRLKNAGYPVAVYDRNRLKAEALAAEGAEVAGSPAALAADGKVIFSCVSDATAIQSVYFGAEGAMRTARPGTLIVEMSTVAPETARQLFHAGREKGIVVLDVPISGSTAAAESGSLTLFGGGDHQAFESLTPIFREIARQWFYVGPSGSGAAMKLVANSLLGVGMQAIAEALALGSQLGIPRDLLFDTLGKTAVIAPAHLGKLTMAKQNDFSPQFPLRLMRKDFRLILSECDALGVEMPATLAAAEANATEADIDPDEDFSAVIRLMDALRDRARLVPPAA